MDILIAILTGLMAITAPVGTVLDQLAKDAVLDQIAGAEQLYVRLDNVPNYQILNGRVDHARLAGRGVYPIPELRIDTLDLETDTIDVDLASLQQGHLKLDQPAQAALHLVLNADDLNQFATTDLVQQLLDTLQFSLPGPGDARQANRYSLANPSLEFLDGDRLRLRLDLRDTVTQDVSAIRIELGLAIEKGHQIKLIDPYIWVDDEKVPSQLLESFVEGAQQQLTLRHLEQFGVIARVLHFEIRDNQFDIAVFARVEPSSPLLSREQSTDVPPAPEGQP